MLWRKVLWLLAGSIQSFNLPERDYYLDRLEHDYPIPLCAPALACAGCLVLQDESLVDLMPLCLVICKTEEKLIRAVVSRVSGLVSFCHAVCRCKT